MSPQKGSNGILDGQRNMEVFVGWVSNTNNFKPFLYQGCLSISKVASACGLNRDIFYTNTDIRDIHWPALNERLENEGVLKPRLVKPADNLSRQPCRDAVSDARIKQIQEEHEAVKAENRELRAENLELKRKQEKLTSIFEILHSTGRIPW